MKLGLFSYSYHLAFGAHEVFRPKQRMDLFGFIERIREIGFDGFQIDPMHLASRDDAYLERIVSAAREGDLYIEHATTGVEAAHMLHELEVAKKLGSPLLRTYLGFDRYQRSIDVRAEIAKAASALAKVAPRAQELGIRIAVENHCDLTANELLGLIEQVGSPAVGVCVDLGNFLIHREDPVQAVSTLASHVVTTHFKDYALKMENWGFKAFGVALGDGMIDIKAILDILKKESKLDRIMLEIPVEKEESESATLAKEDDFVRRSARYAREVLGIRRLDASKPNDNPHSA